MPSYPAIPYGRADFKKIRLEGCLYVDKTRFVRRIEAKRHVFFIRPRRFGKTCWLALLECYYDRTEKEDFKQVFAGTDIGRDPTADRSRYVVVFFDFSAIRKALETLEQRFEEYCHRHIENAMERNPDLFPEAERRSVLAAPGTGGKLDQLFLYVRDRGIPLYVMIDEYDNFANTILAQDGADAYRSFTHGSGFYRDFFATLKAGTRSGGLERLFVTGVSPITMDDVTSGFNIGANISLEPKFNEMLGFTEAEVREVLETYRDHGVLPQEPDGALDAMREWYDGYRFAKDTDPDIYNTDMVLYYLRKSIVNERPPRELIDDNIRIDYTKLRHLLVVNRQASRADLNGNFDLLRHVAAEEQAECRIRPSFPLDRLAERENFLSLMHFFGLLSIRGAAEGGLPRLGIPNQTVKQLMYGYLRDGWRDAGAFVVDLYALERMMYAMAYRGAWRPVLECLADAVAQQTGIRDYIAGEKVLHGFLAAYMGIADCFLFRSERELNGGYADICLEPSLAGHPQMRHGYLLELEYLKRGTGNAPAVEAAARQAGAQLRQYLADEALASQYPSVRFTGIALVFHGWEMAWCDAVAGDGDPGRAGIEAS